MLHLIMFNNISYEPYICIPVNIPLPTDFLEPTGSGPPAGTVKLTFYVLEQLASMVFDYVVPTNDAMSSRKLQRLYSVEIRLCPSGADDWQER